MPRCRPASSSIATRPSRACSRLRRSRRRCARATTPPSSATSPLAARPARATTSIRALRTRPRSRGSDMPPGTKVFDLAWTFGHLDQVWTRIIQHFQLILIPLAAGIIISLVLAIWAVRQRWVYPPITLLTGVLYTIPSLAAFAVLKPILGLNLLTAWIPLTTYTLLILFRNFTAGFTAVPAEILESAEGMGYTRRQRLLRVELPLAIPLMIAGIRLASVTTIGLATIAAVLGDTFGGLGQLITEGIQTFFPTQYLLGAFLSILLAFGADFLFVRLERLITPWTRA